MLKNVWLIFDFKCKIIKIKNCLIGILHQIRGYYMKSSLYVTLVTEWDEKFYFFKRKVAGVSRLLIDVVYIVIDSEYCVCIVNMLAYECIMEFGVERKDTNDVMRYCY